MRPGGTPVDRELSKIVVVAVHVLLLRDTFLFSTFVISDDDDRSGSPTGRKKPLY